MAEGDFMATPIPAEVATGAYANFKTFGDLHKAYGEARTALSRRPSMADSDPPGDDAGRRAVLKKLGHAPPDNAAGYELPDAPMAKNLRTWAHKHGLTPGQAKGMWEDLNAHMTGETNGARQRQEDRRTKAETALRAEWGANYDKEAEAVRKGIEWLFPGETSKLFELSPARHDPAVLKQLNAIGKGLQGGQFMSAGGGGSGTGDLAGIKAKRIAMDKDADFQKIRKDPLHPQHKDKMKEYQALFEQEAKLATASSAGAA